MDDMARKPHVFSEVLDGQSQPVPRAERRDARLAKPLQTPSKPNKHDRRLIHRFKQSGG